MPVLCVGLNHRTAPIEVRERYAVAEEAIPGVLARLRALSGAAEAVWLSTCNRVELYAAGDGLTPEVLREFLVGTSRVGGEPPGDSLYLLPEPHSLEHLFRVAGGLDSMVLGETEILGQLKRAYELARQQGHTGGRLNRAFQRAFNVAKQIRSETGIQRGGISVASVAVELAERIFEAVTGRTVLVIGTGDTGEKVTRALLSRGAARVLLANRSAERAEALAADLGPRAEFVADWAEAAPRVDIVVSSTSASRYILDAGRVQRLMDTQGQRPLLLIDLAVPRDIDPAVIALPDVYLFNVDDLQAIAQAHLHRREGEIARCEALIRSKVATLLAGSGAGAAEMPGSVPSHA